MFQALPSALYVGFPIIDSQTSRQLYHFLQFSHGGWEIGYDPSVLLKSNLHLPSMYESIDELSRRSLLEAFGKYPVDSKIYQLSKNITRLENSDSLLKSHLINFHPTSATHPSFFGFLWSDFLPNHLENKHTESIQFIKNRGLAYGQTLLEILMDLASTREETYLRAVFRGHQHNNNVGPLLKYLIRFHGLVNMFDSGFWNRGPHSKHSFYTLFSAPESGTGFNINSYIVINIPNNQSDLLIEHFYKRFDSLIPYKRDVYWMI
eukprot:Sdes_comp18543_c0_seq2m8617